MSGRGRHRPHLSSARRGVSAVSQRVPRRRQRLRDVPVQAADDLRAGLRDLLRLRQRPRRSGLSHLRLQPASDRSLLRGGMRPRAGHSHRRSVSDGKTIAGPICLRDQSGVCGWRITTCPTPPPAPPTSARVRARPAPMLSARTARRSRAPRACPPPTEAAVGPVICPPSAWTRALHQATTGTAPASACRTRRPAPAPPARSASPRSEAPPSPTRRPASARCRTRALPCARGHRDSPCVCLAASDGKCTPSSAGNCTCDNGIR